MSFVVTVPRLTGATTMMVDPAPPGEFYHPGAPVDLGNTGVLPQPGPYSAAVLAATAEKQTVFDTEVYVLDQEVIAETAAARVLSKVPCVTKNCMPAPTTAINGNPDAPPSSYVPWQPDQPQQYYNTCGPASTRLWVWHKTGSDPGESRFYGPENVTPNTHQGTSDGYIASAINSYLGYNDVGPSRIKSPDAKQLHAMVVEDSYYYGESVIENVDTEGLPNWTGPDRVQHSYWHFDVLYGYDDNNTSDPSGGNLKLAEEYDPHYLGYSTNWDPYGPSFSFGSEFFANAIGASPDKDIVW